MKRGTIWKTKYSVSCRIWTDRQQHRLKENMANPAKITRKLSENQLKHKFKIRNKLRATAKIRTKQFQNLLNRVLRSLSRIQAVEDEDGNVISERKQLKDFVLSDLSIVFKGQRSQVVCTKANNLLKQQRLSIMRTMRTGFQTASSQMPMKPRCVGLQRWWK